jgi:ferritin-like protein
MTDAITIILLCGLAAVAIWAQWCAIRRAEDLACKLAAMRDEAGRLYAENMRLRDELEARR